MTWNAQNSRQLVELILVVGINITSALTQANVFAPGSTSAKIIAAASQSMVTLGWIISHHYLERFLQGSEENSSANPNQPAALTTVAPVVSSPIVDSSILAAADFPDVN